MATGGARPGAGRKGYYDEIMVKKIMASANNIILNTLDGKGKYKDVSPEVILEIAVRFSLKGVPQVVDFERTESKYLEIMHKIEGLDSEALRSLIQYSRSRALPVGTA